MPGSKAGVDARRSPETNEIPTQEDEVIIHYHFREEGRGRDGGREGEGGRESGREGGREGEGT